MSSGVGEISLNSLEKVTNKHNKLHIESQILNGSEGLNDLLHKPTTESIKQKLSIEDFELQGVLGEGSYGKVYCAIEKQKQKKFAIKVQDKYHIMKVIL